jgi:hypothetical protein
VIYITRTELNDLQIAKAMLISQNLTLCIVKSEELVYMTTQRGVSGFLEALEKKGNGLEAASVADKVVGKAVAFLCAYAKIRAVYASIISCKAQTVLRRYHAHCEWDNLVEDILNSDGTSVCPFEKQAEQALNPLDAYKKLKAMQNSMKQCR